MTHPFVELAPEYAHDLAILQVTKPTEVDAIARRLIGGNAIPQYSAVQHALGIPIAWQAPTCERESGADFRCTPANGQPWNERTTEVPRGRGPYDSWYAAAIDTWHNVDHIDDNSAPWSMPYAMWKWEIQNGFGYRAHGRRSPYVVGGTNLQQIGRYDRDSHFVEEWDTQIGTLPVALRMIELMPALAFGPAVARIAAPSIIPPSLPVPAGVGGALPGGALTGTMWLQDSLNHLMLPTSDRLAVDGIYGRFTRGAVRNYQLSVGIAADGLIGDQTCAMIDRDLAKLPH